MMVITALIVTLAVALIMVSIATVITEFFRLFDDGKETKEEKEKGL